MNQISQRVVDIAIGEIASGGAQIGVAFGSVLPRIWDAVKEDIPLVLVGDGLRLVVFADKVANALIDPVTVIANVTASLPARIGLAVILEYSDAALFPDVTTSRVLTERSAAAETVRQVCLAGLQAGGFSIKATSAIGMLMAATESAAGGRGRLALLLTGKIGKYVSKAINSRIKAVVLLVVDGLLRAAFSVSCVFLAIWLVNNWKTEAALPQDNPRKWVTSTQRTRIREDQDGE